MKLSASLILYYLRKNFPGIAVSSWVSREAQLRYSLVCEGHDIAEDGVVYIADDATDLSLLRNLSRKMILFTAQAGTPPVRDYPNCCLLPPGIDAAHVFLFVQKIFDRYNQWNQALMDSRLANESIQQLIDLTDGIIPNPMMVIGMDFTIIASKKLPYGELKNSVLGSNEATRPLVNALKQDSGYEEASNRVGYFYYPGNEVATPHLCVNIINSGKTVYRLLISEGEVPLDDTFGFVLEYLAKMIAHGLSINGAGAQGAVRSLHRTFLTLLTDPKADYVEISQQLSASGWLSSHYYLCALINTGFLDMKNLTLHSLCSYAENSIPSSCAVEYKGNAVLYINLTLCPFSEDEIFQKLAALIRDSYLSAGYSRRMLGHFNFQRQYVQAFTALQLGKQQNPSSWIHHFNQIALPYICEQATKKLPAYMICHEKLLNLKYEDDQNKTQLYPTLRCYLEHHQNIARASEALFIHRSTLLYRLEKIRKTMKTDFSSPEELLYLLLSFYLLDREEES